MFLRKNHPESAVGCSDRQRNHNPAKRIERGAEHSLIPKVERRGTPDSALYGNTSHENPIVQCFSFIPRARHGQEKSLKWDWGEFGKGLLFPFFLIIQILLMLIKTADTLAKILLPFALVGGGIVGGWWVGSKTWGFVQNTDPAPFLNFMLTENSFLAAFGDPLYWIIAVIAFIVVFRAIAMKIFNK